MIYAYAWAVFVVIMAIVGIYRLWADSYYDWYSNTLLATFILLCAAILATIPIWLTQNHRSPDLATLKKNEWECNVSHKEQIFTGKVWITTTACDVYIRKGVLD